MADTTLPGLFGFGDHASRPAASAVGSGGLYACTTHNLIYQTDGSSWSTWATLGTAGAVTGPGSSTGDDFVQWNGAGGDTLKDGGLSLDTDGTLAANSDTRVPSQQAVKTYVDQLLGAAHALEYKGATDCSANPNYPAGVVGDVYMVSVAGKIGGASGTSVNAGDLFVCVTDNAGGTQAGVGADWDVIHATATGSVTGPGSATSGDIVTFNGTTGAVIQDSGVAIDTDGTLAADSDAKVATQKATKMYVDTVVSGGGGPSGTFVLADSGGEETLDTVATSGASQTIDAADGNVHDITLTADCTFTLSAVTSGKGCTITLILRQDGTGGWEVTWPGSVVWIGTGAAPTLQTAASAVDSVVLFTVDGGTTWYGVAQTSASGLASGTSFPGSPSGGDLFYRTDRRILYEYNATATKWLSLDRKYVPFTNSRFVNSSGSTGVWGWIPLFEDVYIETFVALIRTGATNNGSNYWTVSFNVQDVATSGGSVVASVASDTSAVSQNNTLTASYNTVVAAATHPSLLVTVAKTGTPSAPDLAFAAVMRSVG